MILSSDDTVRPIPRYMVILLPRYGRGITQHLQPILYSVYKRQVIWHNAGPTSQIK